MSSSVQSSSYSEEIPNSPSELILKNHLENHKFSLEEVEKIIDSLSYEDEDNLIYHLLQNKMKFFLFMLEKSKNDDSINQLSVTSDLTKMKIIKDLYYTI